VDVVGYNPGHDGAVAHLRDGRLTFSVEAEKELRRKAAQNIVSWVRTGRPDYPVVHGTRVPAA